MPVARSSRRSSWRVALVLCGTFAAAAAMSACSTASGSATEAEAEAVVVDVRTVRPVARDLVRSLRVTGSITADEQAVVSAETAGRVVATPVERGTRVAAGATLVQLSAEQASAQVAEAEASAAQIAAGLGLGPDETLDIERVPDVATARAEWRFAEAEHERFRQLRDQQVVSQSEYDQRATRVESTRQRYETERNLARQRYRAYEAARARLRLARKALADTSVRAPFSGIVGERFVGVGDFVATGNRVASLVKDTPLRVALTVPEQAVARIHEGQAVALMVDAHPGRRFEATIRFISPALRADQRSLTVEAIVPNDDGALKPGLFATAEIAQAGTVPALLVSSRLVHAQGTTSRVFVVEDDRVSERIVQIGQVVGDLVEVVAGIAATDDVADAAGADLADGMRVRVVGSAADARPASR